MLRGLSFPVYCALSCTVLHLVGLVRSSERKLR
jgi:hypothetical protein